MRLLGYTYVPKEPHQSAKRRAASGFLSENYFLSVMMGERSSHEITAAGHQGHHLSVLRRTGLTAEKVSHDIARNWAAQDCGSWKLVSRHLVLVGVPRRVPEERMGASGFYGTLLRHLGCKYCFAQTFLGLA